MNSGNAYVLDDLDTVPEKLEGHASFFDNRSIGRSGTYHSHSAGQMRQRRSLDHDASADRFETSVGK